MESGVWGGQAQGGFRFGTSVGFEAIMPTSSMMDFYVPRHRGDPWRVFRWLSKVRCKYFHQQPSCRAVNEGWRWY